MEFRDDRQAQYQTYPIDALKAQLEQHFPDAVDAYVIDNAEGAELVISVGLRLERRGATIAAPVDEAGIEDALIQLGAIEAPEPAKVDG